MATDYIMKILGLDICSDTVVGNDMLRGISGGQRKRVTTGKITQIHDCPNPVHQEFGKRLSSIGLCKQQLNIRSTIIAFPIAQAM